MSFQNFSYDLEFTLSFQEQDTPSSSLFSSDTEEVTGVKVISSVQHQNIHDSIKSKLQGMLQLLEQDQDVLVQDAGPLRSGPGPGCLLLVFLMLQ
jgi:hypothetical protein